MVTLNYARNVEDRVNELLAQGNIEAAQLQAQNITGGGQGVRNTENRINAAISAAAGARQQVEDAQRAPAPPPPVVDDGGGPVYSYDEDPETRRMREQLAWSERQAALMRQEEQMNILATLTGVFNEYGLGSLLPAIQRYVQQGYREDAIRVMLRETSEYKQRFPAMESLRQKGRVISEAAYVEYERLAAELEQQYGLPQRMLQDRVTTLLTNEVSATELNERVLLASANSLQAPQELRATLQRFYGIDSGGLTAYFLDPDVATPLLERQAAAARIGTEAVRQGIGIDVFGAENLQQLGITQEGARAGFGQVAGQRGFSEGRGDVVTQEQMIAGTFYDQAESANVERARLARLGRFEAGGQFVSGQQGVMGLASSAST